MKKTLLSGLILLAGSVFFLPIVSNASVIASQLWQDTPTSFSTTSGTILMQDLGLINTSATVTPIVEVRGLWNGLGSGDKTFLATLFCYTDAAYTVACSPPNAATKVMLPAVDSSTSYVSSYYYATHSQWASSRYWRLSLYWGDSSPNAVKLAGTVFGTKGCSRDMCYPANNIYFRVLESLSDQGSGGLQIISPVDGLYAVPSFPNWKVRVPSEVVAQIPNVGNGYRLQVQYGLSSGAYGYVDSIEVGYSALDYSIAVSPAGSEFERDQKFSLGTPSIPRTWYAVAKIYGDSDDDGTFDELVQTSSEIIFVYYPGSSLFQGGEFSGTTTNSYMTYQTGGTWQCPEGLICESATGTRFRIDRNGNIVVEQGTSTIDYGFFGKFYGEWQPLATKVPWGYFTLMKRIIYTGTTTATTTYQGVDVSGLESFVNNFPILSNIRTMIGVMLWLGTVIYITRASLTLFT